MERKVVLTFICIAAALGGAGASAREIHVATTGSDSGRGDQAAPLLTINQAASIAQHRAKIHEYE